MFEEKRKGLSTKSLLSLVLGVMAVSLFATLVMFSPLYDSAEHGSDLIGESVNPQIEIHEVQHMSDLAMFVYHRGSSCGDVEDQNGNDGYPGLSHTYLGQYPECFGGSDSFARGLKGISPSEQGNDMEGNYGREKFVVKERVVIDAGESGPWLNNNFYTAGQEGFGELASMECGGHSVFEDLGDAIRGTDSNYNIFFRPTPKEERSNVWVMDYTNQNPYCVDALDASEPLDALKTAVTEQGSPSVKVVGEEADTQVVLCPGDKGYVQMNKGKILNDGESERKATGDTSKWPHIVITETGNETECGGVEIEDREPIDFWWDPENPEIDAPVTFDAGVVPGFTDHEWEIDLGSETAEGEGMTFTHTFEEAGTYNVTLSLRDEYEERDLTKTKEITVEDPNSEDSGDQDGSSGSGLEDSGFVIELKNFKRSELDNSELGYNIRLRNEGEDRYVCFRFYGKDNGEEVYIGHVPGDTNKQDTLIESGQTKPYKSNTGDVTAQYWSFGGHGDYTYEKGYYDKYFQDYLRVELYEITGDKIGSAHPDCNGERVATIHNSEN